MSKRTKRWLSIVTTLAVAFVMTFGCMGEVFAVENQTDGEQPASVEQTEPAAPAEEDAATEPAEQEEAVEGDVEALGGDTNETVALTVIKPDGTSVEFYIDDDGEDDKGTPQLYYFKDENKVYLESVAVDYTAMNNQGNGDALYDACGPKVVEILDAAGIKSYNTGTITFAEMYKGNVKYSATFGCDELFKTRYAYPCSRANYEEGEGEPDYGAAVTTKEKRFKTEVPVIINLKGTMANCFGQEGPSDRNKPGFIQNVASGGVIRVSTDAPTKCTATSVVGTVKTFTGYTVRAQNVQPLRAQLNQPISVHLKEPIALNSTT